MSSTDKNLAHLEVYREFKRKMSQSQPGANVSPFDDRISTSGTTDGDVADIHLEVRRRIRDIILDVRDGKKKPQVILLSGAAGMSDGRVVLPGRLPLQNCLHSAQFLRPRLRAKARASLKVRYFLRRGATLPVPSQSPIPTHPLSA